MSRVFICTQQLLILSTKKAHCLVGDDGECDMTTADQRLLESESHWTATAATCFVASESNYSSCLRYSIYIMLKRVSAYKDIFRQWRLFVFYACVTHFSVI